MLSYIAGNSTSDLIKTICQELNITILNQEVEEIDFLKCIKETKVNFNLIRYFVIELKQLKNTDDEIIASIKYFKEMYANTRIIVIAKDYDSQNAILTSLYENGIYNIINETEEQQVKEQIKKCLVLGLQEKDARRFKKTEVSKIDTKKKSPIVSKLKEKLNKIMIIRKIKENIRTQNQVNSSVYFFAIFVDTVKSLVRLLYYIEVFILTSFGLKILFNGELRSMVFQILGLK